MRTASILALSLTICSLAVGQEIFGPPGGAPPAPPATQPGAKGRLEHIKVDVKAKTIRIDCEALNPQMALEFFCVKTGTAEHESILRTEAVPSEIHTALLMLGLKAGAPVTFHQATQKWIPPHGPPLQISVEFKKGDKMVTLPANRLMRNVKTKKTMPATTWIFAGSRVMEDGVYAADATGYVVSVVNFDLTLIDIPELASNSNELLEWEFDPDVVPKTGTAVTMIIEPVGKDQPIQKGAAPADDVPKAQIDKPLVTVDAQGQIELDRVPVKAEHLTEAIEKLKAVRPVEIRLSAEPKADPAVIDRVREVIKAADVAVITVTPPTDPADVRLDEQRLRDLRTRWDKALRPHGAALKQAAKTHYAVIGELRREQERLIQESDRLQRLIDQLEKEYQELTIPRP